MKIILIRHGSKQENQSPDKYQSLSGGGIQQVNQLGKKLSNPKNLNIKSIDQKSIVFFTSPYKHSEETAKLLIEQWKLCGEPISLENLKPDNISRNFDKLFKEALQKKKNLEDLEVVAFVGHYPFLRQLQQYLTKNRISQVIQRGEAACFRGTFQDFLDGNGTFDFNITENSNRVIEEQLRLKIQSKMTVSTFLAGFTFAVLNDLLKTKSFNMPQTIAAISMTGSLLLFVASVYMYDNMTMPKEYWSKQSNRKIHFTTDHDLLHHYMIRTWKWVFTPAVALALIGFIATLFNTGNDLMIVVVVVIILGVILYYFKMKPVLGQD